MNNKILKKLKKQMETGAKAIETGNKAIEAIKKTQQKVVDDFALSVQKTVEESKATIDYHQQIILEAEGMKL